MTRFASGPVAVKAVPDGYSGSFLSHDMEPIEQVLRVWVEVELELAHRVAAIREQGDLLVQLMAL
jgi:hypothetical protein